MSENLLYFFLWIIIDFRNAFSINSSFINNKTCTIEENSHEFNRIPRSVFHKSFSKSKQDPCPPFEVNMDNLTEDAFTSILTDPCRYDHEAKPPSKRALQVSVQVDLAMMEILAQTQFSAHMLVQYLYTDSRLNFEKISPKRSSLLGGELLKKKIWIPHILLRNEKDSRYKGMDGKDVFLSISPKGEVVYSYRVTAVFFCWMNWQKFPFDSQECSLRWNSWAYNSSQLVLSWDKDVPINVANNLHLTEFIMSGYGTKDNIFTAPFLKGPFSGNFSEIIFHFELSRQVGYYFLDFFLPSILLVFTSWVTFWVQADVPAARVVLGCNTMMAFIALNGVLKRNLPTVSYMKASEIWFFACACFIFASLTEFAFVNVIWRRKKNVEVKEQNGKCILKGAIKPSWTRNNSRVSSSFSSYTNLDSSFENDAKRNCPVVFINGETSSTTSSNQDNMSVDTATISENNAQQNKTMTPQEISIWIDRKARIVFPVMFVVFNIFYWSFVYLL